MQPYVVNLKSFSLEIQKTIQEVEFIPDSRVREWNLIRACRHILLTLKTNELTENIIIYQGNLTLLDLPENSLFMIPVSIMTKIPMKRTDDPSIHMKQILRPFSSSQVKKDWIFKHTFSGVVTIGGKVTLWQNCKLGLWLYQLWSYPIIISVQFFAQKLTIFSLPNFLVCTVPNESYHFCAVLLHKWLL